MPSCSTTKLGLAAPTTKNKDCCPPPRQKGMPRRTEAEALEDVSARMLQGWTMLGDACPVAGCNTPLVRSRQGEVWCARCGAAVVKEGDAMSVPSSPPSTTEVAQKARAAWAEAAARDDDDAWRYQVSGHDGLTTGWHHHVLGRGQIVTRGSSGPPHGE